MNIQTYLKKHGITQKKFARMVGVNQSMVSQWVTGMRPISALSAVRIDKTTSGELSRTALRPDIFN